MAVYEAAENSIICKFDGETVRIEGWGNDGLRVRAVPNGAVMDTRYALLGKENILPIKTNKMRVEAEIVISKDEISITNGKIKAKIIEDDWRKRAVIHYYNQKDEELISEIDCGGALDLSARNFQIDGTGTYKLTATFVSDPKEKLYGMGQYQQEIMDIKNCNFELAHRNSQASVPFILSSKGYGFLWHNPAIGRASFGRNRTEWVAERTRQLDYYIVAGDTPAEIEERYSAVTGRVPMMPEYGLGFWQCKLRYWNQEQLLNVAREYYKRKIPVDVIVCDFFHWPRMGDYRFDEKFFPEPEKMIAELKSMGMELMVSVWPQVDTRSENYEEMRQHGYLVKANSGVQLGMRFGGESMFFDATNPDTREYIWKKCKNNYYDKGVALFWLDEAEPEYNPYDISHYHYYAGAATEVGNIYPQLYSKTFYDGMKKAGNEKIVNLVRCAWAGSQRYGALVWSGDIHSSFEDLRKQFCAGLHMGICGIPWWTTDIGGFSGGDPTNPAFRQLLIRWFQYGTYCPVMRLHGDRYPQTQITGSDGLPAVPTGADNEIWSFGEEAYKILKHYITVREQMRDYTRELMKQAHELGTPVMRTMFYEFPQDEECWNIENQYMYGSKYLVAPVLYEGMKERTVYLPKSHMWQNVDTQENFEGGQTITVQTPIENIPVFRKVSLEE